MSSLIISSWDNYRIAHMKGSDDLEGALNRIMPLCGYPEIYPKGKPFILNSDITIKISADWIINFDSGDTGKKGNLIVINLCDDGSSSIPETIRTYMEGIGIKTIDYPPVPVNDDRSRRAIDVTETGDDINSMVETMLVLLDQPFSKNVEIPVYQGKKTGFDLIIKADFSFRYRGNDYIIDLEGLSPDIITLLEDHGFSVLSISGKESLYAIVTGILDILYIEFNSQPHLFSINDSIGSKNIEFKLPGITFQNQYSQQIFATHLRLPKELIAFIAEKGFRVLHLSPFRPL